MEWLTKHLNPLPLEQIRNVLRFLIGTYAIGWVLIGINASELDLVDVTFWRIVSAVMIGMTLWLACKLSFTALVWWTSTTILTVCLRTYGFGDDGKFDPIGVWFVAMSGIAITNLAVIFANVLTGRLAGLKGK
jgi:hypothetical protein